MTNIALLFLLFTACSAIHTATMAVTGSLVGARVVEVSLFFGPKLFSVELNGVCYSLRAVPFGAFVRFAEPKNDDDDGDNFFQSLARWRQLVVILSGNVVLLLGAVFVLRSDAVPAYIRGFTQAVSGAIDPFAQGKTLVLLALSELARGKLLLTTAFIAAKFAAFNMLPLASLNGGHALLAIAGKLGDPESQSLRHFNLISMVALLMLFGGWLLAAISAVVTTLGA